MSDTLATFTCKFCTSKVIIKEEKCLVYCLCKQLGVDYTKHYIRFLGSVPLEYKNIKHTV
jgi:hypothetical protein